MCQRDAAAAPNGEPAAPAGPLAAASAPGSTPHPDGAVRPLLGVLAVLAAAITWSLSGSLIKLLHQGGAGVPGLTIACYRALAAGLVLMPLAVPRRASLRSAPVGWLAASVAAFTVMTAFFVVATARTAAASVILLQYTAPVWVFCLSPLLLAERPGRGEGLALAFALAGVLVIFVGNPASDLPALLMAMVSGAGYGLLTMILRRLRACSPFALMCANCLASGLLMLPLVVAGGQWRIPLDRLPLLLVFSLQFALPYLMFSWGLRHLQAHRASLISLLEVGLNPLWAWLLAGERTPAATLAGGPLIVAGVAGWLLLVWRRERGA